MKAWLQDFYNKSSWLIQTLMLNSYAVKIHLERYGKKFETVAEELKRNERLSYAELIEYQNEKLRYLVKHAYETVPYYNRIMKKIGIRPSDIKCVNDLEKLPVLTREDVKANTAELVSRAFKKRKLIPGHTSGTTGSPLNFFWDQNMCIYNNAADWRQKNWAGLNYKDKYAVILGRMIVPREKDSPPFWRMNYLHNQLWLSSFHLSEKNMAKYVEKIEKYKPKAIEAYPSTAFILARFLEKRNITFPLRAVLTSSEPLHAIQRETIERSFECKVFDFYGMAERVIFAGECDRHEGLHLNMDYGITEILDDRNEPVGEEKFGWLVGTSLHNYGMPFIRYKTSDVSAIRKEKCKCGREFPLMSAVTTKAEDIVTTKDGRFISPSVLTHPFKPMHNIKMSQIIQEDIDYIRIKIVKGKDYTEEDTKTLLRNFKERVGSEMKVEIEFVDSLERMESGKFKWVISKVPIKL